MIFITYIKDGFSYLNIFKSQTKLADIIASNVIYLVYVPVYKI